jgi:hypothetical protein
MRYFQWAALSTRGSQVFELNTRLWFASGDVAPGSDVTVNVVRCPAGSSCALGSHTRAQDGLTPHFEFTVAGPERGFHCRDKALPLPMLAGRR